MLRICSPSDAGWGEQPSRNPQTVSRGQTGHPYDKTFPGSRVSAEFTSVNDISLDTFTAYDYYDEV